MRRTFLSDKFGKYADDMVNTIVEGIQIRGGEIISVGLSPYGVHCSAERLLIMYEDHENVEEIKKYLSFYLRIN